MEKKELKFTILLASFNGAEYFQDQVQSILNQTRSGQLIIYDDASTDQKFIDSLQQLQQDYSTIKVIYRSSNLGVVENFRQGIYENTNAEIIALSDQDDLWDSNKLNIIHEYFSDSDQPLLVYHDASIINEKGLLIHPSFFEYQGKAHYEHNLETFLFGNFVSGACCAFNKSLIPFIARMPKLSKSLHDEWIALVALVFGQTIRINQPLNLYRKHSTNVAFKRGQVSAPAIRLRSIYEQLKPLKNVFLKDKIELVKEFLRVFKGEVPEEKRRILEDFLRLENQSGWKKKVTLKKVLKKHKLL